MDASVLGVELQPELSPALSRLMRSAVENRKAMGTPQKEVRGVGLIEPPHMGNGPNETGWFFMIL